MGRSKLKKFAEIKTFENVFNCESDIKGKWTKNFFKNKNPIVLELGCGQGHYTVALAQKFPNKNFIGIDRKGNRIWGAAKKAIQEKWNNIAFLNINIETLEKFFEKNEVDEIWITFPDPYPKPSKAGRRLSSSRFLDIYRGVIKKNGIIHLKTDSLKLFDFSVETVKKEKCKILEEMRDIHSKESMKNRDIELKDLLDIKTFYEDKFMKEGRSIYYLRFSLGSKRCKQDK